MSKRQTTSRNTMNQTDLSVSVGSNLTSGTVLEQLVARGLVTSAGGSISGGSTSGVLRLAWRGRRHRRDAAHPGLVLNAWNRKQASEQHVHAGVIQRAHRVTLPSRDILSSRYTTREERRIRSEPNIEDDSSTGEAPVECGAAG